MENFLKEFYKWLIVIALAFLFSKIVSGQNISGSGTLANPYILYNAADVDSIHTLGVNNRYRLGDDIDMTGISWIPLTVTSADSFGLDGDGYTLSDLTILWNHTYKNSGFIGDFASGGGSTSIDTVFQRITFYNTIVHFDSTTATADLGIILNGGVLIGSATVSTSADYDLIYNVLIKKSRVWCRNGYGAGADVNAGGVIGRLNRTSFGGEFDLLEVGVDSNTVFAWTTNAQSDAPAVGGLTGRTNWNNNSIFQECFVKNSYLQCNYSGAEFAEDGNLGGLVGTCENASFTISNCYVFNNTLRHQGRGGGISDPPRGGGIQGGAGTINTPVSNSYVAANTYLRDLTAIENSDFLGWWWGALTVTIDHSTNYLDTTGIFVPVWFGVYGQGSNISLGDSVNLRSTALMKTEGNYVDWDFDDVWGMIEDFNEGYPHLLWESPYSLELTLPVAGFYLINTTTDVKWTSSDFQDTFIVFISYDNGDFYNIVDSVFADSVLAISLDTVTTQAIVKVKSINYDVEVFSQVFTILSDISIMITDVSLAGHIATVEVLSVGIEAWRIFQDADTTGEWEYLLGIKTGIDPDELTFDTLIVELVGMENPYIKAEEFRDTTVYGFSVEFLDDDGLILSPNQICYNHDQYLYGSRWIRDVACGWATVPFEYGTSTIDSITHTNLLSISYETVLSPPAPVPFSLPANETNYSPDSVTVGGRRYIVSGETLYMRDLINNVIYPVHNLSPYFIAGLSGMQNMTGIAEFDGKLIIASHWKAWLFTAFEEPNLGGAFIYDIYQIVGDVIVVRNYFRGIHPKATKNLKHEWDKN
jgi:hypothetical protein